ncbi:MAG: hypothetical protein HY247_08145 [archaeon]|nr:MAG: hypothetical protein HY247_08145 [archaeon]
MLPSISKISTLRNVSLELSTPGSNPENQFDTVEGGAYISTLRMMTYEPLAKSDGGFARKWVWAGRDSNSGNEGIVALLTARQAYH